MYSIAEISPRPPFFNPDHYYYHFYNQLSGLKVCNASISENLAEGLLEPFFLLEKSDHNVVEGGDRKKV